MYVYHQKTAMGAIKDMISKDILTVEAMDLEAALTELLLYLYVEQRSFKNWNFFDALSSFFVVSRLLRVVGTQLVFQNVPTGMLK